MPSYDTTIVTTCWPHVGAAFSSRALRNRAMYWAAKEEADRLWKVVMVLHKEQAEARSMLEEAFRESRDQRAIMIDRRRELAPLATAVQPDVASISEQVSAMAERIAWGLDGLRNGLVDMGLQLAQLTGRMNACPPVATATSVPHGSPAPGRFQTTNEDQPERIITRFLGDCQAVLKIAERGLACGPRGSMPFAEADLSCTLAASSIPLTSISAALTAPNPSGLMSLDAGSALGTVRGRVKQ